MHGAADGDHHTPAGLELLHQGRRDVIGGSGDNNRVERRVFRPAVVPVGELDVDVVVPEPFQAGGGAAGTPTPRSNT